MKPPGTLIMSVLNIFANDPLGLQPQSPWQITSTSQIALMKMSMILPPTKAHHLQLKEGIRAMLEPTLRIPMSLGGAKRDTNRKLGR
jgi:hypothetical protein